MGSAKYFEAIKTIRLDLLELFGSGYVIEHCISVFNKSAKDDTFRFYVSDCLKNINDIIATRFGGSYISQRLSEFIPNTGKKEKELTGDEIAADIIKRAGLSMKGGEE